MGKMCDQTGEPVEASELDTERMHQLRLLLLELLKNIRELRNETTEFTLAVRRERKDMADFWKRTRKACADIRREIRVVKKEVEENHSKRMRLLSSFGRLEFS